MGRKLVFSDLHGQYKLWEQIKDFIQPEDEVYCLGDCGDRGPDGWKIIKEVLDTPNITYLKGNHEQFIIDEDYMLWEWNGGRETETAMFADPDAEAYIKRIEQLPDRHFVLTEDGKVISLCHAGFDLFSPYEITDDDLIWDRTHFNYPWPEGEFQDFYIIHGHTPIPYLIEHFMMPRPNVDWESGPFWYAGGHKCCIDCGSFLTGKTTILDLDTFEHYDFEDGEEGEWYLV